MYPKANHEQFLTQPVGDELIVYDQQRDRAHHLSPTAALIWRHCDGKRSIADLAALLQPHPDVDSGPLVRQALADLERAHLLESSVAETAQDAFTAAVTAAVTAAQSSKLTRRAAMRKMAVAGGIAVALPVVTSIVAPTPAMAASGKVPPARLFGSGSNLGGELFGGAAATLVAARHAHVVLFQQPDITSGKVTRILRDEIVVLLATQDDFLKVQTAKGLVGWTKAHDLQIVSSPPKTP